MRYGLEFTTSASRELNSLDTQVRKRIITKITGLCDDPFPSGTKKLQGLPNHFRIRVGDYRIVYRVDGDRVIVVIVKIGHRKEVYR
jgi:mRNA interferase RelE/StbE